jgi:hypothetical protein
MNISVDAQYRRQISELWYQWKRSQQPPKQPGEFRLNEFVVEPPMHGPDAHNRLNFALAPEDFLGLLKASHIPYTVN